MRRVLLLTTLALLGAAPLVRAQAPITITQADMPQPRDTLRVSQGVADSLLNFRQTGPNQTWNFANLIPLRQRVETFVDPTSLGGFVSLTFGALGGANRASVATPTQLPIDSLPGGGGLQLGDINAFFRRNTGDYRQVGYSATLNGLSIPFTFQSAQQQDIVYRFPLTFNAADSSRSYFEANVPGTVFLAQEQNRVNRCDGWGTLTTPFGTFSTIRLRTRLDTYDSLVVNGQAPFAIQIPPRYEYKWLANGQHIPLLTISTILTGGRELVTSVVWRDIYRRIVLPTGLPAAPAALANLTLAPNPLSANEGLTLRGLPTGAVTVEIFDALGRHWLTYPATGPTTTLPAAALPTAPGLLLVRVRSAAGVSRPQRLVRMTGQ